MVLSNLNTVGTLVQTEPFPSKQSLADIWITPKQLEAELGISIRVQEIMRTKKRQLNDAHPLPFSKFGKFILYNRDRIQKWLLDSEVRIER